jgi:hypothetical protein
MNGKRNDISSADNNGKQNKKIATEPLFKNCEGR